MGALLLPGWRRAFAAISMLGAATFAGAVMVFLTQTLLARELGPEDYGLFASSLATVTMVAPMAGFGLTQFLLKAFGVEGWAAIRWLPTALRFLRYTTLLAIALVLGWALLGAPRNDTRFDLLVLWPVILGVLAIELVGNRCRLEDRLGAMALWQMAIPAGRLLVALALLLLPHLSGRFVALAYCAISLGVAGLAWPRIRAMLHGDFDLHGHGPRPAAAAPAPAPPMGALWSEAWAYGVYFALYPVFFQISTILLKYLAGDAQAGLYSIALAVLTAIYLVPAVIYHKFLLVRLHRWAAHNPPKFRAVYRQGNIGMLLLGLAVGAGVVLCSPWVVPLVFGESYRGVVAILMVLALCPPIRFLSTAMGAALLTQDNMRFRVYAMATATVVAIGLNALLIPRYAEQGAAWATVVAEAVLLLGTAVGVRRFHRLQRAGDGVA
ncbi:MAG TPA: polysaccharide biosynthesis C-terminal domain-containing protein [Xanthomonadaceae bacterium]|nr:polysaccharide biosynthesis C-terminal domain-containing protein [Xanthomonadaceae bacterium]